jgi:transcriptional regulator with XRE-family HTH domain
MNLRDYMAAHGLTDEAMGKLIGRHRTRVSRYRRGLERPDWSAVARIAEATAGAVGAADWVAPPADRQDAA